MKKPRRTLSDHFAHYFTLCVMLNLVIGSHSHASTLNVSITGNRNGGRDQALFPGSGTVSSTNNHWPAVGITVSPLFVFPDSIDIMVIATNGQSAEVVLDGSSSRDPDNDPLQFRWQDGDDLISTNAMTVAALSVGTHSVSLDVSDGFLAETATMNVDVISPARAVGMLQDFVDGLPLNGKRKNPLLASLGAAESALNRGRSQSGISALEGFQHKIQADAGHIDPLLARQLMLISDELLDALTGRPSSFPTPPLGPGPGQPPPMPQPPLPPVPGPGL